MITRKQRYIVALAAALALVAPFVYAGGGSEQAAASPNVSFMWWGDEVRHVATNKAVAEFVKANPGKNVTAMPNPFDGYHDKIIIQLANGTAPDLFCFSTEWMAEVGFAAKPVLKDLNELSANIDLKTFNSTLLGGGTINGKLLGIPTGISGWSYFYNKNVLSQFAAKSGRGLPPAPGSSWTVEDMIAYGREFKKTMGSNYALLSTSKDALSHFLVSMLSEIAGKFYINERAELQFTEQNLVDTFKLFARMTEAGVLPAGAQQVESISGTTVTTTYNASGEWAGWFGWTSNIVANAKVANSDIGIMAYPSLGRPEFDGLFVRPAQFWSISSSSKNPKLAADLLNFIANNPAAIAALEMQRSVPPTEAGQKVLADKGILKGPVYESTQYLMKTAASKYTPFILIPELTETLRNEYGRFITGKSSAEASAKALMPEFERIVSAMRKANGI